MPRLSDLFKRHPKGPQKPPSGYLPPEIRGPGGQVAHEYQNYGLITGDQTGPSGEQGAYALAHGKSGDVTRHPLPQDPANPKSVFVPNGSAGVVKSMGKDSIMLDLADRGMFHFRRQDVSDMKAPEARQNPLERIPTPPPMPEVKPVGPRQELVDDLYDPSLSNPPRKGSIRVHRSAHLVQRDGKWALVSRKDPSKVLKWFGAERPSDAAVAKEEARVEYFKHHGAAPRHGAATPQVSSTWKLVEPATLNGEGGDALHKRSFAAGATFVFAGSDGVFYTLRSIDGPARFTVPPRVFGELFAPAQVQRRSVPPTLRGLPMTGRPRPRPESRVGHVRVRGKQSPMLPSNSLAPMVVKSGMPSGGHDLKIPDGVVEGVAVDVMNMLGRSQDTPQMSFHDDSVLAPVAPSGALVDVPVRAARAVRVQMSTLIRSPESVTNYGDVESSESRAQAALDTSRALNGLSDGATMSAQGHRAAKGRNFDDVFSYVQPTSIRLQVLGRIHGLDVVLVDSERIRDEVDVDWTMGGNPGVYGYVPPGEVWVARELGDEDRAATIIHEVAELHRMENGETYDQAHEHANLLEMLFRSSVGEDFDEDPVGAAWGFLTKYEKVPANELKSVKTHEPLHEVHMPEGRVDDEKNVEDDRTERATHTAAGVVNLQGVADAISAPVAKATFEFLREAQKSGHLSGGFDSSKLSEVGAKLVIESAEQLMRVRSLDGNGRTVGGYLESPVLKKPDADKLFRGTRLVLVGRDEGSTRGEFYSGKGGSIAIYVRSIIKDILNQAWRGAPSYEEVHSAFKSTVAHELRHAADWAYQEAVRPYKFDQQNPDMPLSVSDRIHGVDREQAREYYANTPTELKSWAGNLAQEIWDAVGRDWRALSGKDISFLAKQVDQDVYSKVREENRPAFLQRVLKALQELEQDKARMKTSRIHVYASKPTRCSHCGKSAGPGEFFGREGRWLHRPCVSLGPVAADMAASASAKTATTTRAQTARHLHYPWHDEGDFHVEADQGHPHTSVPEPPVKNEQAVSRGQAAGDVYRGIAKDYGALNPGQPTNLRFYDYREHEPKIDDMIKEHGYQVYYAGGKYGKPDLAGRNYNTGHLMVYDPTPESGGDFGDEATTRSWRKIHELSHGLTYGGLNEKYGEGRRIGKLGSHRTLREAKRAVEWEWMAAHKQRELSNKVGHPIDEATFARELNTVMHDAVHRAITGKFTNPDEEGFVPSDKVVPLEVSLKKLEEAAHRMGLKGEDDVLSKHVKASVSLTSFNRLPPHARFVALSLEDKAVLVKVNDRYAVDAAGRAYHIHPGERVMPSQERVAKVRVLGQEGPMPRLDEETEEHGPSPEHPVDLPGFAPGHTYDYRTQKVYDPQGWRLVNKPTPATMFDPRNPQKPGLRGEESRQHWIDAFLPTLSPEERAHLEHVEHERNTQSKGRSDLKKRIQQVKELEAKLLDAPLKKSDQEKLDRYREDVIRLRQEFDEGLHHPARDIPEASQVRLGQDLSMHRNDQADSKVGVANILKALEAARPDEIDYWKDWYKYARDDVEELAKKYHKPPQVVAGIVAALSPNVPWESNVHAAEQVLRGRGRKVIDYRKRLGELAATHLLPKLYPDLYLKHETLGTFGYLNNIEKAQRILDTYDRVGKWDKEPGSNQQLDWDPQNEKSLQKAERQFQDALDKGYKAFYTKSPTTWMKTSKPMTEFDPGARRAIMVPALGDPDKAKKVTAFYKSIMLPEQMHDKVVLDGHAQNIFYGEPRRLSDLKRSMTDEKWNKMVDAYKQASKEARPILKAKAKQLREQAKAATNEVTRKSLLEQAERLEETKSISPQQMQAITWSVWREAIPKKFKNISEDEDDADDSEQGEGEADEAAKPSAKPSSKKAMSVRVTAAGALGAREMKEHLKRPGTFGAISAYKSQLPKHENQGRHGELYQDLLKKGYPASSIRPMRGQYEGVAEQSFLVFGAKVEDLLELARKYSQDSVLFKGDDGLVGIYYGDGKLQVAETPEGQPAAGLDAVRVEPRHPKEEKQGPPAKEDLWSKGRSVAWEAPINWSRGGLTHDGHPVSLQEVQRMMRGPSTSTETEAPEVPPARALPSRPSVVGPAPEVRASRSALLQRPSIPRELGAGPPQAEVRT